MLSHLSFELNQHTPRASLVAQVVKNPPAMWETWVRSLSWEDLLEEGMATHSVFLPGESHGQRSLVGYSPRGHRVGHGGSEAPYKETLINLKRDSFCSLTLACFVHILLKELSLGRGRNLDGNKPPREPLLFNVLYLHCDLKEIMYKLTFFWKMKI